MTEHQMLTGEELGTLDGYVDRAMERGMPNCFVKPETLVRLIVTARAVNDLKEQVEALTVEGFCGADHATKWLAIKGCTTCHYEAERDRLAGEVERLRGELAKMQERTNEALLVSIFGTKDQDEQAAEADKAPDLRCAWSWGFSAGARSVSDALATGAEGGRSE